METVLTSTTYISSELQYVYDTAEITARRLTDLTGDFVVPGKVVEEIRKGFLARKLESVEESIKVMDPDNASRKKVRAAATETGDIGVLSETDIDVIAVALMIGGTVVSDDYAIQNTCEHMGIPAESSSISGIRKEIRWIWRCTGCRKKFRKQLDKCTVCGHDLKRIPASSRDL